MNDDSEWFKNNWTCSFRYSDVVDDQYNENSDTDDDLDDGDGDVEYRFGMLNTRDELAGGEIN